MMHFFMEIRSQNASESSNRLFRVPVVTPSNLGHQVVSAWCWFVHYEGCLSRSLLCVSYRGQWSTCHCSPAICVVKKLPNLPTNHESFLGSGFKHFLFSPLPGEMIQFD